MPQSSDSEEEGTESGRSETKQLDKSFSEFLKVENGTNGREGLKFSSFTNQTNNMRYLEDGQGEFDIWPFESEEYIDWI